MPFHAGAPPGGGMPPVVYTPTRRHASLPPGGGGSQTTGDLPNPWYGNPAILGNPQASSAPTYITDTFIPLVNPIPVLYGPFRTGGQLFIDKRTGSGGKLCGWVVSLGQLNAFTSILVQQRTLSDWGASFNVYVGDPAQTADPLIALAFDPVLCAKFGAGIDPKTGIALAYIIAQFLAPDGNTVTDPDPYQFLVEGTGRLVSDPSLGVNASTNVPSHAKVYSDNPILCMADWIAASTKAYGCGQNVNTIDWASSDPASVLNSAAACAVDIGGGTKRFTISASINSAGDPWQEVENMRAACQAMAPVYNNGLWRFPMDLAQASSGIVISDDHSVDDIVDIGPLTVAGPNDVKTRVRVSFTDTLNKYQVTTTPADDDPGIATGAVPVEDVTEQITYCPTYDQAVRLGRYRRKRYGMDKSFPFTLQPDGIRLLPGVRFTVGHSTKLNFSNVECICTDINPIPNSPTGQWAGRAELYDPALYDDTKATATAFAPPAVLSPHDTPPTPAAPALTQEGMTIRVDVVPPSPTYPFYGDTIVYVSWPGHAETELGRLASGSLRLNGVTMGVTYSFRSKVRQSVATLGLVQFLGLASVAATITPAAAQAEWPVFVLTGGLDGRLELQLSAAPTRTRTLYDGTHWTQNGGFSGFDASKVNNGNLTDTAGTAGGSGAFLFFDAGVGQSVKVREIKMTTAAQFFSGGGAPTYSTDGGATWISTGQSFLGAMPEGAGVSSDARTHSQEYWTDENPGVSSRLWRFFITPGTVLKEMQLYVYDDNVDPNTFSYDIYDVSTSVPRLVMNIPAAGVKTLAQRTANGDAVTKVNVTQYITRDVSTDPTSYRLNLRLAGANISGTDSETVDAVTLNWIFDAATAPSSAPATMSGVEKFQNKTFDAVTAGATLDSLTVQGANIPSAATTNIGAGTGRNINITGTTTITAFDNVAAGIERVLKFAGILTLTHNGTSLILPGAANIVTTAGDEATFLSLGSGNWRCTDYLYAGAPSVALTLANGLNSNIAAPTSATPSLLDITGPTAAFSIGGFTPPYPAKALIVVNRTGFPMTIVNEDASSTAANRIATQTGSSAISQGNNPVLASPDAVRFEYDAAASRWVLMSSVYQVAADQMNNTMRLDAYGTGFLGILRMQSGRGTSAAPAASVSGDEIGSIRIAGLDTSGTPAAVRAVKLSAFVDSTVSGGIVPGRFTVATMDAEGVEAERFRVTAAGITIAGGSPLAGYLSATTTWNPGAVNTGTQTSKTITVTGAAVGDLVIAGFNQDLQSTQMTAYVSSANTVTVVLSNETGGDITFTSGTLKVAVFK